MAPSETTNAPLRIVHINLTDSQGGAAIAARRLHLALRRAGHDSRMLVWRKYTDDPFVEIFEKGAFRRGLSQVVGRKLDEFGLQYLFHPASMRLPEHPWLREADIVNLHLGHGGYLSTRALPRLSRRAPLVWTMHDLWAVSGHCAFAAADDCNRWLTGCGRASWSSLSASRICWRRASRCESPSNGASRIPWCCGGRPALAKPRWRNCWLAPAKPSSSGCRR